MIPAVLALAACAPSPAEALQRALSDEVDAAEALAWCRRSDRPDECTATVVRRRADAGDEACAAVTDARWRAECHFAAAERHARAGDRWSALVGCGRAGTYYNECLYHAWTFELQATLGSPGDGPGRAVDGVDAARPVVAFWSAVETIGPAAEAQLWRDWWYFAHARNKPADLSACASLPDPSDRTRCEDGTRTFVRRAVTEELIRPSTRAELRDRLCRSAPGEARTLLGELYRPDPALDAEAAAALAAACGAGEGRVERPWNPVFRERRG